MEKSKITNQYLFLRGRERSNFLFFNVYIYIRGDNMYLCVGFELCQSMGIRQDGQKFPSKQLKNILQPI
jgi:hypothetical protein